MIHGKLRDSRGPCRDHVGILICFVKNYVIHVKLRDSRKTTWFIKNSLITFSLKEIAPIFWYILYSRNWYYWYSWETRPKWEIIDYILVPTLCVLCVDSILSLQTRKQYMWGYSGIHENPRFPPLSNKITALECDFFSPNTNTQFYKRPLWNSHRMVSSVYLFFFVVLLATWTTQIMCKCANAQMVWCKPGWDTLFHQ